MTSAGLAGSLGVIMNKLLVFQLAVQSSYTDNVEHEADGNQFDTVQWWFSESETWRIKTFAIDQDIHTHCIAGQVAGMTEVYRITGGASGPQNIDWAKVLVSGSVGAGIASAASLPFKAMYAFGAELVSSAMRKLGEVIGLSASKSKLVAGLVPDAATGLRLELSAARPGGRTISLLDESIPEFSGGETLMLGGKLLFEVPQARTLIRQDALDWYVRQYNQLLKQIDTSLPVAKQLEMLDKAGEAIRKAAQTALIDTQAAAELAGQVSRLSLEQLTQKLGAELKLSGDALQAKVLEAMRKVAVGCFIAGTLVHTKEGLKPIEQIQVGDWVLSRPEDPEQGTETGYKRVTKTFRFEDKEVVRFWWTPQPGGGFAKTESVYVTPNHPVWLNPNGWVAMGRLYLPEKLRPGTIHRGNDEWLNKELVLADGSTGAMLDVMDLYRTNRPEVAFEEEDGWDFGGLTDFSGEQPSFGEDLPYDYEQWGDPVNETRERYTTTVYNFEVEDWHTYFVGKTGLWVHNTNCAEATLEVAAGKGDVAELLKGVLQFGNEGNFKQLTKAELNQFLKNNPNTKEGIAVIRMDGAGKVALSHLA